MENIKLNSSLLPLVDVCMYGGVLDRNDFESEYNELMQDEENSTEYELDWDKFDVAVLEIAAQYVEREIMPLLKKYGVTGFQPIDIWHPREYNFQTDELDFDLELSDDFYDKMKENVVKFQKEDDGTMQDWIGSNWKSRDGFWSYMPQSFDEILHPVNPFCEEAQRVGAYLTLCLLKEGWDEDDYRESSCVIYEELECNYYDIWENPKTETVA